MAKEWAWSFSKLKNYETCPKRHYEIDLQKAFAEKQEAGGPLDYGKRVHEALAAALKNKAPIADADLSYLQPWADRVLAGPGRILVEQKYAITRQFQPTAYFAPNVWYRGVGDVVQIAEPVAFVLDWKTGKIKVDSVQLMLMAQCIFAHFPAVQKVRSEFVWLQEDCTTPEYYTRQDVADAWFGLLERVGAMENAAKTMTYPPKPSGLCRNHCVVTSCPFHGKGSR
jgi:hypothetical protein